MKKFLSIAFIFAFIAVLVNYSEAYTTSEIFSFGFREDDAENLRAKFNDAILSMKHDGTMTILQAKYLYDTAEPMSFRKYNAAGKIKIAVTDETKSFFSMAVLSDISRRLRMNVEIIHVRDGEEISALLSGKVDAILQHRPAAQKGITLSEPYYTNFLTRI